MVPSGSTNPDNSLTIRYEKQVFFRTSNVLGMNAAANKDAFTFVLLYRNRLVITNQHFVFDYKFNGFEMDAETDYVMTIQAEYLPGAVGPTVA